MPHDLWLFSPVTCTHIASEIAELGSPTLKKKKKRWKEEDRVGLQEYCVKHPLELGKKKGWPWKLFIHENGFGRSGSVRTDTWGRESGRPWKPLLLTSAVPHRTAPSLRRRAGVSLDSNHKANYLELAILIPKNVCKGGV